MNRPDQPPANQPRQHTAGGPTMILSWRKVFLLAAIICAVVAVIAVVFDISNPKVYPGSIALSLAFGWVGLLFP